MKICYIIIIISIVSVPVGGQTENDAEKYNMIVIGSGIKVSFKCEHMHVLKRCYLQHTG